MSTGSPLQQATPQSHPEKQWSKTRSGRVTHGQQGESRSAADTHAAQQAPSTPWPVRHPTSPPGCQFLEKEPGPCVHGIHGPGLHMAPVPSHSSPTTTRRRSHRGRLQTRLDHVSQMSVSPATGPQGWSHTAPESPPPLGARSGSVSLPDSNSWGLRQTETKGVACTRLVTQPNLI